jgi:5-methylcytosine-specific restriction endonuclease McrA
VTEVIAPGGISHVDIPFHSGMIEHMFDTAERVASALAELVGGFDPDGLDGPAAVEWLELFDRLERLATAGKALAASQVEATEAWRASGQRDAIGFVAARTASSRRQVRDALGVVVHLAGLPKLNRALRAGSVSLAQAADIAAAAGEHPETEAELLELAATASLRALRERCVEILASGEGAERQHRRARAERSCSSQVGRDATWRLSASLPIAAGAVVDAALDHFQNQIFDEARSAGEREPFGAYRADALVRMARAAMCEGCSGGCGAQVADDGAQVAGGTVEHADARASRSRRRPSRSSSLRHAIVVTVPHTLFLTGTGSSGEVCHVPGVGAVPVSVVRQLMEHDPIVKTIVTRGREVTAIATMTRRVKDDLRLAVLHQHAYRCGVPTCDNTRFLELDHRIEFAKGGPTSIENLRPLCSVHHDQRTTEGYQLEGEPGDLRWVAPDGTVLAAERAASQASS